MATKKATPAQIAARKLFAQRSKAGLLTKKPKASRDYARDAAVERAEAALRIAKKTAKRKANPTEKRTPQRKTAPGAVMRNPIKKKITKRNPIDFGGQSGQSGVKATEAALKAKLEKLENALGRPAWKTNNPASEGALGLDKSDTGYRLVQLMVSGGERDLSDRLTAKEMMNFLDGANLVARAVKK